MSTRSAARPPDSSAVGTSVRFLLGTLASVVMLAVPPATQAGGTLGFSELIPMLRRKPQLSGFLFQAFRLPDSAVAAVRLGSHFPHLGGKRLGPYLFEAQPRDSPTSEAALISLCTEARFLDAAGNPLPFGDNDPLPTEAIAVREEITAIVIRDPSASGTGYGCP